MSYPQVVRVFVTSQEPDYDCPWQSLRTSNSTGSGVILSNNEILTGAHVVANATFVKVQRNNRPEKFVAEVKAVCHDCDLALLSVKGSRFFKDLPPVEIGEIPKLRDKVSVVGFPVGGEEISITEGVVSRIEVQSYSHSHRKLLAVTVDAAINRGNSGGPVFQNGKIAGVAFQKMDDADNIGEMVPTSLIKHFLEGVHQRKSTNISIPSLSISTQKLENPLLRKDLGISKDLTGVLVKSVSHGGSAWGKLKPRDVLLKIDGLDIANNGTVNYLGQYRTQYDVVLGEYYVGDTLKVKVLREGKERNLNIKLKPLEVLVPSCQHDILPTYYLYGGLVFQPLSYNFLNTWDEWWEKAPSEFLHHYYSGVRCKEREEIIVLTQVLSDEVNIGYENLYNESVRTINGKVPRNMQDLVQHLNSSTKRVEIETSSRSLIILDAQEVKKKMPRIMKRYHIKQACSKDLQKAKQR